MNCKPSIWPRQPADLIPAAEVSRPKVEVANTKVEVANTKVEVANTKVEVANTKVEVANTKVEVANTKVEVANTKVEVPIVEVQRSTLRKSEKSSVIPHFLLRQPVRTDCRAFSLIEILVVVTLLSVVVLALMDVFSTTQRAFRAAVTQTDVLEGSRAAMDLIASDLRTMTPSDDYSTLNFCSRGNYSYYGTYQPLMQNLPGSASTRTNLLNSFFIISRQNTTWIGTGYFVDHSSTVNGLFPLYRWSKSYSTQYSPSNLPAWFQTAVSNNITSGVWTNMSHLMDGVVHLVVRPYDPNGVWMSPSYPPTNNFYIYSAWGESQVYFYSNAIPASVELQMAVVEDRALQRAESLSASYSAMTNYLANQSGAVHVFRQIVTIPNVDRSAYP